MSNTLGIAREKAGLEGRESKSKGPRSGSKVDRLSAHAQMTGILGVGTREMGKGRDGKLSESEQDVYKCTRLRDDRRVVPGRYSKLLYIE